ncbi:MAG: sialate O-acetylesterase, partial [bacterium]
MKIILFLVLVVVVFAGFVLAVEKDMKLSLSPIFSEHMVLQRDVPLEIFGMASPGKKIIVDIAGQSVVGIVSKNGEWTVKLLPITAGGPYELKVICGNEIIHFTDVLAGDVWFCSGQSNMEWILGNTFDGADELKNFKPQPNIRLFLQQQKALPTPLKEAAGVWTECTADNTKTFSAVAYFFAKHLQKEINIPIGLIDSSWGGTSIEIWIKESLLKGNPATQPIIDRWKNDPIYDWKHWNNGNGMDFSLELSDIRFESSKGRAKPL